MHQRLFVLTSKENASNSKDARDYVESFLLNEGFASEGFFSSGYSDWFVIGGRWSGELQKALMKGDFFKEVEKEINPEHKNFGLSTREIKDNKKKLQEIWERMGGKGENPYTRDTYAKNGFDDDAMVVTKEIWDKLLKPYETNDYKGYAEEGGNLEAVDIEAEEITEENLVGKKWVVVVDYHY